MRIQDMCCGGTTVRATCEYHGPQAVASEPALFNAKEDRVAFVFSGTIVNMRDVQTPFHTSFDESMSGRTVFTVRASSDVGQKLHAMYTADLCALHPSPSAFLMPGAFAAHNAWFESVTACGAIACYAVRFVYATSLVGAP